MTGYLPEEIAAVCSGSFFPGDSGSEELRFRSAAIDSRKWEPGDVFFAIKGAQTGVDGHGFLEKLTECHLAVVSKAWRKNHEEETAGLKRSGMGLVAVADPLQALIALARDYRSRLDNLRVVAVTGSYGKTGCKEMVAAMLSRRYSVFATPGNLNSDIGLPLSLLRMEPDTEIAVLELGISQPGDMDLLAELAKPEAALITGIGTAHIAAFGSREAIAAEKGKLLAALPESGAAFLPEYDGFSVFLASLTTARTICWGDGAPGYDGCAERTDGEPGMDLLFAGERIHTPFIGEFHGKNFLASLTAARYFGVNDKEIIGGVKRWLTNLKNMRTESSFGRGEWLAFGGLSILRDCYNSSPETCAALLRWLGGHNDGKRKIFVMGDMLELGGYSMEAHKQIGIFAAEVLKRPDLGFFYGEESKHAYAAYGKSGGTGEWFDSYEKLETRLRGTVKTGDLVVLKGSRGMALERLTRPLEKLFASKGGVSE